MRHDIELAAFQDWYNEAELVYAFSTREKKKLVATPIGNLIVRVNNEAIWVGSNLSTAVEKYNSITEPFDK